VALPDATDQAIEHRIVPTKVIKTIHETFDALKRSQVLYVKCAKSAKVS